MSTRPLAAARLAQCFMACPVLGNLLGPPVKREATPNESCLRPCRSSCTQIFVPVYIGIHCDPSRHAAVQQKFQQEMVTHQGTRADHDTSSVTPDIRNLYHISRWAHQHSTTSTHIQTNSTHGNRAIHAAPRVLTERNECGKRSNEQLSATLIHFQQRQPGQLEQSPTTSTWELNPVCSPCTQLRLPARTPAHRNFPRCGRYSHPASCTGSHASRILVSSQTPQP
jgi:hypothetical protein